ncbi:Imm5 family immunity protein [Microcoleus sp. N3A4]|uniref:Imm5 family immunity protein n=1 Tax=Microcoleus sp. N3A4 TaxID=3055379 RepID=UPI002FD26CA8
MNALPEAIQQILKEGRSSITERGELPALNREKLYKEFEEFLPTKPKYVAHYWRARLELNCALKVLQNWESCELADSSARQLLYDAEKYLVGELESEKLERKKSLFYSQAEDLMDNGPQYFVAAYAGFACISAVNATLYDLDFDTVGLPEIETEPDFWTACFHASLAYCGGATWEKGVGDDLKRREFWEWFLDDAVPALWQI